MKPAVRYYQTENDYWCIRDFLQQVSLFNERHTHGHSCVGIIGFGAST
jgi:hypothetical protein